MAQNLRPKAPFATVTSAAHGLLTPVGMQTMHSVHPRPSVAEALDRGQAANRRTQRAIWIGFYAGLGLLLAIGLAVGLLHTPAVGNEALPPPPVVR